MLQLRLPKLLALCVLTLGLFSATFASNITPLRTGPVSQYGMLMTGVNAQNEGRVYGSCNAYSDTSGNEVQVKGMSLFWSNEKSQNRFWRNDVITGMVSQQGIQVIRAAMAVDDQGWGNGHYFVNGKTAYYQDLLDETVQAAIEQDIYVIIDYHSHTAVDNVGRAKEFFKIQAKKWGSYPNVIFEIYNEPICKAGQGHGNSSNCTMITWPEIKAYANEVIPIIRRYSNNLIVVGTPSWSGNPGAVVGNAITGYDNIAYTFHYYAGKDDGSDAHDFISMSADVNSAIGAGLSVFVTEWGTVGYGGDGAPSMANNPQWQTWMNLKKLSSANWNAGRNMTKDGAENSEYFADFDVDNTSPANWTYSASGEWVNANVFNGLSAMTYSQCASYVDLPAVPADDPDFDDSGDDFGDNIYEDEVISHDYVIDDFDGNNSANEYHYYYESGKEGDWTNDNNGESIFYVDGSNVGGVVGVVTGDSGWAGYGVHVETLKGCETFSYRFRGLAHGFTLGDKVAQSVTESGDWVKMTFDLTGIDPDDLDVPFTIQWQVAGPSSGDSLLIDDVQCGDPSSGSNDSPVPPYMIDDFDGDQVEGYIYVTTYGNGAYGNELLEPGVFNVFFPGEGGGAAAGVVGASASYVPKEDLYSGVSLEKEVPGLAGCSWISYRYKGPGHKFRVKMPSVMDGNFHSVMVQDEAPDWETALIDASRLEQEDWGTPKELDMSQINAISWEMNEVSGANFFVDNVQCLAEKPAEDPIEPYEYVVSDFDGNGTMIYPYVFSYGASSYTNDWDASCDNGNGCSVVLMEDAAYTGDFGAALVGVASTMPESDNPRDGAAVINVYVPNLEGCKTLKYAYKGAGHTVIIRYDNDDDETYWVGEASAKAEWEIKKVSVAGLTLDRVTDIRFQIFGQPDPDYLYIDDVECVQPASSSSSTSSSSSSSDVVEAYLVEDFSWGGTAEYKYVFADTWTIANSMSHPGWSQNPDDMEYDVTTRDSEQGIVGAVLQVSRVGEEEGGAGIGVHISNLSGCATLQYKYKGLEHNLAFFNNQNNVIYAERFNRADNGWMTVTYDMNRAVAEGLDIDAALDIQWHVLEPDGETDLLVDDVKCLQPANSSSSSGDEPASSSSNVLPDAAAPTTYAALFDDFEDGDYYPLWDGIGQWWVETDQGGNGGATTATLDFVEGSSSQYALQMEYTYDVGDYQWGPPYAAVSTNDFMEMNLSQCRAVQYDYKGAAHKFRVKVSKKMNDLLDMGWGFPTFAVTSPSESWRTITVPIASMQQEWTGSNEIYTPVETVIQYANGFDWRVDGDSVNDKSSGSLAIDNIRCVGLDHYAAISVEVVDGKLAATIDGAFTDPEGVNIPSPIVVDTVVFDRTFSASGYSTITLPFSINRNAIEGVSKMLAFSGIGRDISGKKQVEMTEIGENGELNAYTPYMVELESEGGLVFHGGTVIQPTEGANTAARSDDGWEFRGTLSKIVWDESHPDLGRVYGFSGKETDKIRIGQFVKAAAGAWITPFRAYMIYAPEGNSVGKSTGYTYVAYEPIPDYMDVVVVNRSATGEESKTVIGGLNTRTGEFKMLQNYDLKGRKLNGKPASRGVYYGKKKVIK